MMRVVAAIDVNCDIGEELDDARDDVLFGLITSASIACGGHAGGPSSMARSVERARAHAVTIGAHISYPDRQGFGRIPMAIGATGIAILVRDQVSALMSIAARHGATVAYVKPHGALYHAAGASLEIADVIAAEVAALDGSMRLIGMPGGAMQAAAGPRFVAEGFPERGYASANALQPRALPGAIIEDPAEVGVRAVQFATRGPVPLIGGGDMRTEVATLCIHSDHPNALANAHAARAALTAAGVELRAFA